MGGLPERKQEEKEERGRIEEWKRLEGCREIVAEGRDRRGKAKRGRERDKTNNMAQMAKKSRLDSMKRKGDAEKRGQMID